MGGPTNDALADDAVAAMSDAALNRTIMDEERNMVGAVHHVQQSYLSTTMMLDADAMSDAHNISYRGTACGVRGKW